MKKAQEYYDLYHENLYSPLISDEQRTEICKMIFMDFSEEAKELIKLRHMKTDEAAIGLIREQNQKWNAMVRLFDERKGFSILIKDGFKTMWQHWGIIA